MRKLLYKIKCCWHILFAKNFSVFADDNVTYWSYLTGDKYFVLHIGILLDKVLDEYLDNEVNNTKNEKMQKS